MFIEFDCQIINTDQIIRIISKYEKDEIEPYRIYIVMTNYEICEEYYDTEQYRDARYTELKNLLQGNK